MPLLPGIITRYSERVRSSPRLCIMSLLCDLPEVLVGSLLVSWVNVEHVGRLDSALCNTSQRPTFLKLINRDNFVFGRPSVCQGRDEVVGLRLFQFQLWLVERDIAVAELAICGSFTHDADKRSRYLQRHGKHIHRVTVGVDAGKLRSCEAAIIDLCVHCPNVTVFECGVPVSSTTTTAIANNWKKLTHITLADNIIGDEHVLIAENCQSLVKLNIWSISWALTCTGCCTSSSGFALQSSRASVWGLFWSLHTPSP
jgi:hypothetical protein